MAYERTWNCAFNYAYTPSTALDQTRYQMWALKAMLTGQMGGLTQGLWTIYGSCDGAGNYGNGDLVDRWGSVYDASKLVRGTAGNAHSWMVLRSPTMNGNTFYLLITFDTSTNTDVNYIMAKTAFSAGTGTANPTSADSWILANGSPTINAGTINILNRFHLSLSTTGDFIWFSSQATQTFPSLAVLVIAPVGCHASDNFPIFSMKRYNTSAVPDTFLASTPVSQYMATRTSSGAAGYHNLFMPTFNSQFSQTRDILTGKYMAFPPYVVVEAGSPYTWHLRGRLPDIHCAPTGMAAPSGTVVRNGVTGAIQYVAVGDFFIPANTLPIFG